MNVLKYFSLFFIGFFLITCTTPSEDEYRPSGSSIYDALEVKDLPKILKTLELEPQIHDLTPFRDSEGNSVLHLIVQKDAVDEFLLLSKNYDLPYNRRNNQYDTPLSMAIAQDHCQLMELLIIKGADPTLISQNHPGLLAETVIQKRYSCMEPLLLNSTIIKQKSSNGWEALHYAVYMNDIKAAHLLISYHPPYLDTVPMDQGVPFVSKEMITGIGDLNPFDIAVVKGYVKMAQLLAQAYPDFLQTTTSNKTTNLQLAEISKSQAMIDWLKSKGEESSSSLKASVALVANEKIFDKTMENISRTHRPKEFRKK